ncbi:N-acetylmuramoyl-L-alanine amidase family protein [Paraliobacillus ryukyuensis]|uniref:N-acetylmuramoyl-L-alanine amidase family protein n=1 Tax=Paraliobacillus ryukyuensis TaxID=200904 RepID=UPI0009A6C418|nr:N-acetylmuramoyl-L-alanine amidase [Paraliobacillus ryukyuensis]
MFIIDPGHGGKDVGGGTNHLWKEKDFVLELSLYQYRRLKDLAVPVKMTRYYDCYLSTEERSERVRESGARFCISNHINSGGGKGAEFIHSIYSNGKNAKILSNRLKHSGQEIRRIFTKTLPSNSKKDYYFMHRETGKVETIIVEYGFADTKGDVERLKENWKLYAEAIVEGICEIANIKYSKSENSKIREMKDKQHQYIGKRVESIVDNLRYYYQPSWSDRWLVNTIDKGIGFPEIVGKVQVGKGEQYKVKNSQGETYYITASEKYVRIV